MLCYIKPLLLCCLAVVTNASSLAAQTTITRFTVDLSPEGVLSPNEVSTGASGEGELTLTQTVGQEPTLDYTLRLFGINPDSLTAFTSDDFPMNPSAPDLAAVHFHTLSDDGMTSPRGTEHTLNAFGPPINQLNGVFSDPPTPNSARPFIHPVELAEDDYVASFDPTTGAAIVSGRWDLADVEANDVGGEDDLGDFGESKPLSSFIDQLLGDPSAGDERIFIMIHTSVFINGEFGGFVRPIPEPAAGALMLLGVGCWALRRRR